MKSLISLLFVGLCISPALAGLDPDTDSMGIYFDTVGNTNCITSPAFFQQSVYLLLMNPADVTNSFECSVTMQGGPYFVLSTDLAGGGENWCYSPDCYQVGGGGNYPVTDGAAWLARWTVMLTAPAELLFYIRGVSGDLPVVSGDGIPRLCGVSSGDVNLPVAGLNAGGNCPVSERVSSFGSVKSLFR
ncbi:MAG: hypothetical protein IPK64_10455 [bacterium]|nr:hypothetical protein [bacterium]